MEFFIGFFGAVAALALFAAGWQWGRRNPPKGGGSTVAEEAEAFRAIQNYSAATAYAMGGENR